MCKVSFFFFSSRRRHTRLTCDWSSDVCSSDLERMSGSQPTQNTTFLFSGNPTFLFGRSEERRVGKGVDLGGRRIIKKKTRKTDTHLEPACRICGENFDLGYYYTCN